jgi:hypothetical protein
MLLNALVLCAAPETFFGPPVKNHFVSQLVEHVIAMGVQLIDIELLDALMLIELVSGVLFIANLAHQLNLRAVSLDMVEELSSCQVLKFLLLANIAAKLRTV